MRREEWRRASRRGGGQVFSGAFPTLALHQQPGSDPSRGRPALAEHSTPVPAGLGAELLSVPGIGLPIERCLGQVFWACFGVEVGRFWEEGEWDLAIGLSSMWVGGDVQEEGGKWGSVL